MTQPINNPHLCGPTLMPNGRLRLIVRRRFSLHHPHPNGALPLLVAFSPRRHSVPRQPTARNQHTAFLKFLGLSSALFGCFGLALTGTLIAGPSAVQLVVASNVVVEVPAHQAVEAFAMHVEEPASTVVEVAKAPSDQGIAARVPPPSHVAPPRIASPSVAVATAVPAAPAVVSVAAVVAPPPAPPSVERTAAPPKVRLFGGKGLFSKRRRRKKG